MVNMHPDAWISPHAIVTGDVTIGAGSRVLDLAVIHAVHGPVVIGSDVVVMEHALLRGRAQHPLVIGDSVLVGPHTHLNGTHVEDEVFIATGASMFPGSRAGTGSELRINSVLQVNSRLRPGTVVPIGWIAAGDPAELFSPDRHDDLWSVQQGLDFPNTVYGVSRETSMREIMRRQSQHYAPDEA
ncbi:gamma carbonic anhydrase family protein [Actinoplanes sp. KI2]|uniref:gamma carbonic anhydrase family protein n=1 Tax=Actinoplanes sp. KI2 TaxID=2983315 RepID=UPI0021D5C3ED|nr:gamma carbonic anhydrase family protein [Actinoplanes sp. KI2]MCU7729656.1 gamma carbonic anhydrase family protein [Actinoplanes sp. KI2]